MKRWWRAKVSAIIGAGVLLSVALSGAPALAAGNGYGAGSPPTSAVAGGFTKIVTTRTFPSAGGTLTGSANGATVRVSIRARSLAHGGQVVLSTGSPRSIKVGRGLKVIADFSIVILNPVTGAKLVGPFDPAISVVIRNPSITSADFLVAVPGSGRVTRIASARLSAGEVVVTFTGDPNFAVVQHV